MSNDADRDEDDQIWGAGPPQSQHRQNHRRRRHQQQQELRRQLQNRRDEGGASPWRSIRLADPAARVSHARTVRTAASCPDQPGPADSAFLQRGADVADGTPAAAQDAARVRWSAPTRAAVAVTVPAIAGTTAATDATASVASGDPSETEQILRAAHAMASRANRGAASMQTSSSTLNMRSSSNTPSPGASYVTPSKSMTTRSSTDSSRSISKNDLSASRSGRQSRSNSQTARYNIIRELVAAEGFDQVSPDGQDINHIDSVNGIDTKTNLRYSDAFSNQSVASKVLSEARKSAGSTSKASIAGETFSDTRTSNSGANRHNESSDDSQLLDIDQSIASSAAPAGSVARLSAISDKHIDNLSRPAEKASEINHTQEQTSTASEKSRVGPVRLGPSQATFSNIREGVNGSVDQDEAELYTHTHDGSVHIGTNSRIDPNRTIEASGMLVPVAREIGSDADTMASNTVVAQPALSHEEMMNTALQQVRRQYVGRMEKDVQQQLKAHLAVANIVEAIPETDDNRDIEGFDDCVNRNTSTNRKPRFIVMGLILFTVIVAVTVAVVATLMPRGNDAQDPRRSAIGGTEFPVSIPSSLTTFAPTTTPTVSHEPSATPTYFVNQTESYYQLVDLLLPSLVAPPVAIDEAVFANPNTVAFRSIDWMANDDTVAPSILARNYDNENDRLRHLLQRYALTMIYLTANGPNWKKQYGFLSDSDVCTWNDGLDGVLCDDATSGLVRALSLRGSEVRGALPAEIYLLTDLESLAVVNTGITGTLSSDIGRLSKLNRLWMPQTRLGGSLPTEIGMLTNMKHIHLEISALIGSIPTEIGKMKDLSRVDLVGNSLTGTIPSEMASLTQLISVKLHNNALTGTLPVQFGMLTSMTQFSVHSNKIHGNWDPIFCFPGQSFAFMNDDFFQPNCIDDSGSYENSLVVCSCCPACCGGPGNVCVDEIPQPEECDGGCVGCSANTYAASCNECPTEPNLICSRSCRWNEETETCEPRSDFELSV